MSIDPRTIPDSVLKSEWARRANAKRSTFGAGQNDQILHEAPQSFGLVADVFDQLA